MIRKEFVDISDVWMWWGDTWTALQRRNKAILSQHPTLKHIGEKVATTLQQTRGLPRILKYIEKSPNPRIPIIIKDILGLKCAHLLLEFLPLLEKIYTLGTGHDLSWIDEYDYMFQWIVSDGITQEQLLALARMKQIIEGKIIHGKDCASWPAHFVEDHLQDHMYSVAPAQLIAIFLILELLSRRIPYLEQLRAQHDDNPTTLLSEVQSKNFQQKGAVQSVSQRGPFLQFCVSRDVMTVLMTKTTRGLFYRQTCNPTLGNALVVTEGAAPSTLRHEQQHHTNAWSTIEETTCTEWSYFYTKDEILAFMAWGGRTFVSIFNILFKNKLYDPHVALENDSYSYDRWREDYRRKLLTNLSCARLLEQKLGCKDAIDVLGFIHFRAWKWELKRVFGIEIPMEVQTLARIPGKEKEMFRVLG